jgi:hypothetical protein
MNKQTMLKYCRALIFPVFLIFAAAVFKTVLSIAAVLVIALDSDSIYLTVYYFLNEILSLLLPLLTAVLLFTLCRHGALALLLPFMLLYQLIFVFCHVIETSFYCQLVFDSFFWWESEDFMFLIDLSLETLGSVLLFGLCALTAYALVPKAYRTHEKEKDASRFIARSLLVICVVFLLGAFLNECFTYTVPILQDVANGYSVLLPIDAVYIVFKYLFYIFLVGIGYFLGIRIDRYYSKKLSCI